MKSVTSYSTPIAAVFFFVVITTVSGAAANELSHLADQLHQKGSKVKSEATAALGLANKKVNEKSSSSSAKDGIGMKDAEKQFREQLHTILPQMDGYFSKIASKHNTNANSVAASAISKSKMSENHASICSACNLIAPAVHELTQNGCTMVNQIGAEQCKITFNPPAGYANKGALAALGHLHALEAPCKLSIELMCKAYLPLRAILGKTETCAPLMCDE